MNYDFQNFLGQNEVVSNTVINRCFSKLFKLQKTLVDLSKDQIDAQTSNTVNIINAPWTPTPTITPTITPTPTVTPTVTPTNAPTFTPTPTPTVTRTPTPTVTPTPTETSVPVTPTPTPTITPTPTSTPPPPPRNTSVQVFMAGGGGSGGGSYVYVGRFNGSNGPGGGGGAGGLIGWTSTTLNLDGATAATITVGSGGASPSAEPTALQGLNGTRSSLVTNLGATIAADGGGGGGYSVYNSDRGGQPTNCSAGNNGGSGGGAGQGRPGYYGSCGGGAATGVGIGTGGGAAGGGACAGGGATTSGNNSGGQGLNLAIDADLVTVLGNNTGNQPVICSGGSGGTVGGGINGGTSGSGARWYGCGGSGATGSSTTQFFRPGTYAGTNPGFTTGGAGYGGVVVMKYLTPTGTDPFYGGTVTILNGYTYRAFKEPGVYTLAVFSPTPQPSTLVWRAGGNALTTRYLGAGFGARADAVISSGATSTARGPNASSTELYNSTTKSWSNGSVNPLALLGTAGCGTKTTGIMGTGNAWVSPYYYPQESMTTFNGTAWTNIASTNWFPTYRRGCGAFGNSSSAIWVTGTDNTTAGSPAYNQCIRWNGTSWSSTGSLTVNRRSVICSGTAAAGLGMTGNTAAPSSTTLSIVTTNEKFNGSTWSSAAVVPAALGISSAAGTQSDTTICGGYNTADTNSVFNFNGVAWGIRDSMPAARNSAQGSTGGSANSLLVTGGVQGSPNSPSTILSSTVEYST